ncbi:glycosyltransferase [Candidatus Parcubacteria bacterium]|nr:glycosyltransferase [Candidatus Parcubacteria bacterium]
MGNPLVSIIVPTFNRPDSLRAVLESLEQQSHRDFEVIVIEGGDFTAAQKAAATSEVVFPFKVLEQKTRAGLAAAVNEGVVASRGELIIRTDDDVEFAPDWLREICRSFEDPQVGGVTGPTIIPADRQSYRDLLSGYEKFRRGNLFWRAVGKIYFDYFLEGRSLEVASWFRCGAFSLGANFEEALQLESPIEVDYLHACNLAVRRSLLEEVGGFNEVYQGTAEYNEAEVAFKLRRRGYKLIFNPQAYVYHLVSRSGVYAARANSCERMKNFVYFYLNNIKPDTPDKALRFSTYLMCNSAFWVFKFFRTGNWRQLGGIAAIFISFWNAGWKRKEYRC